MLMLLTLKQIFYLPLRPLWDEKYSSSRIIVIIYYQPEQTTMGGGNKQADRSGWQRKDQQPELALQVWPGAWQDRK